MIDLPNGCRCSKFTVIPKKWETGGSALLKKNWAIVYRFYKPSGESKQIWIRGMNRFKTLPERQRETNISLVKEYQFLKEGLDPLEEKKPAVSGDETGSNKSVINSKSLFLEALDYAFERACKRVKDKTKNTFSSEYTYIKLAILNIGLDKYEISEIRVMQITNLFDEIERLYKSNKKLKWTNDRNNRYRKSLVTYFNILVKKEVAEYNPVLNIEPLAVLKKFRPTLNEDEGKRINDFLLTQPKLYTFFFLVK